MFLIRACLGYTPWSEWSDVCSRTCGGGIKNRSRDCLLENTADCTWLYDEMNCNEHLCQGKDSV